MFMTISSFLTVTKRSKVKHLACPGSKLPDPGKIVPKSLISENIRNDGGIRIPSFTEKQVR
jgi:hypothetical protein